MAAHNRSCGGRPVASRGALCAVACFVLTKGGVNLGRRIRSADKLCKAGCQGWQQARNFRIVCGRRCVRWYEKFLAEGDLPDGDPNEALFTKIETLSLTAGDAVSLEVFEQQLAKCGIGNPHCPHCGSEGWRVKQRDRTVQTRRGLDVPLDEQEYYCPGCRRAFFPSVQSSGPGPGRGL